MYAWPVSFPETSNREDLYRTVSIFDDDTGQPINLAGILNLQNPNGFTGSNWNVNAGISATTSVTTFTVPGYPVSGQLSALTIVVAPGLIINPGDPVVIADALGNASIAGMVTSYTPSTGVLACQIGLTFQLEVRREKQHPTINDYSPFFDFGGGTVSGGAAPLISAALGTGLSVIDLGFLLINIPETTVRQLASFTARSYIAALTMTDSVSTRQILIARLPILYGGVTN
jgi:hypothetical protein